MRGACAFERFGDGGDVLGRVAAAAAGDVDEAVLCEVAEEAGHVARAEVEAGLGERVGQAGVGVAGDGYVGFLGELFEERVHEVGAEGAVEADGERLDVLDGVPEGFGGLGGDQGLAAAAYGCGDHDRELLLVLVEDFADGDEGGLGVEGVEDGFDEEQVGAAGDEGADLLGVGGLDLIEGDYAEAGVVGIGRVRERDGQGADGSGYEALAAGVVGDAIGPFAALLRGFFVDLPGEVVEQRVFDDLLVEVGVFAAAVLARVVDEELALGDAGGAEGVGLDDVGAGFEEAAMDVADHVRLGEGEEVTVVQQVLGGVFEALAADVGFLHAVGADGRAHRSVDDGDAGFEDLFQRMLLGCLHFYSMSFPLARCVVASIVVRRAIEARR